MNKKNVTMGMAGLAAVGAAAMLMKPKKPPHEEGAQERGRGRGYDFPHDRLIFRKEKEKNLENPLHFSFGCANISKLSRKT